MLIQSIPLHIADNNCFLVGVISSLQDMKPKGVLYHKETQQGQREEWYL